MNINKALFKFIRIAATVLAVLLFIYFIVLICSFCFDFGYRIFNEPAVSEAPGEDIMISISDDMSAGDLGKMLEEKGLVKDGTLFKVQLLLSAYKKDMEPGVYTLNTSMTAKEMMVKIAQVNEEKNSQKETQSESQKESSTQPKKDADGN